MPLSAAEHLVRCAVEAAGAGDQERAEQEMHDADHAAGAEAAAAAKAEAATAARLQPAVAAAEAAEELEGAELLLLADP